MNKNVIIGLVVVVIVGGGAAYGLTRNKDKSNTSSTGSSSQTSTTPPPSTNNSSNSSSGSGSSNSSSSSEQTDSVTINNFAFSPASITVKKGTTVTWTNKDSVAHTVQETDGKSGPKSDDLAQGATYTYTFTAAGTYAYHCSIHPDMTGTVTVTE